MRPQAVIWFERLNLATIALGIVQSWLASDSMRQLGQSIAFTVTVQIFVMALLVGLTLLISRRRSKVAMWVLVGLFLLGLPTMFLILRDGLLFGSHMISAVQTIGQLAALTLLFTRPARRWMSGKSDSDLGDVFA